MRRDSSRYNVFFFLVASTLLLCFLSSSVLFSTHGGKASAADSVFYDFVAQAPSASWSSGAGSLTFPGSDSDSRGFAIYRDNWQLEDNSTKSRVLETHPQWVSKGWIRGAYPQLTVPSDAELKIIVGFLKGATGSDGVTFEVKFEEFLGLKVAPKVYSIFSHLATYDGKLDSIVQELSSIEGKTGSFVLSVYAGESSGQDWAVWAEAKTLVVAPTTAPGSIQLTPGTAENLVATEHRLAATVLDTTKKPMAGVKVSFTITGANPITGAAVTDGTGQAYFSYYGANPGDDTITATVDKLTATAYKQWKPKPAPASLPDLYLSKIICDTQEKRIGYVIENIGTEIAPSGHITALLSDNERVDSHTVEVSLVPGESYTGYFQNFEFYTTVEVTVSSDYEDDVLELNEVNNSETQRCELEVPDVPAIPLPDLIVHPYQPVGYRSNNYGEVGFYYTIWNRGDAPAPSSQSALYIDGIKVCVAEVAGLDPGESRQESFSVYWDCTLGDEDTIEIQVDDPNDIAEHSDLNNRYVARWTCSLCALPRIDLVVSDVVIYSYVDTDGLVYFNRQAIRYELHNRGAAESPETTAHLLIDGEEVETKPVASLESGGTRYEYFWYDWTCTGREDRLTVWVEPVSYVVRDPSGVDVGLGELDTLNNRVTEVLECELPDLRITNANCSGSRCQYTISNEGNYPAGSSTTSLYISNDRGILYVLNDEVAGLNAGQSRDEIVELDYICVPPVNTISFTADRNDVIEEIDEENNGYTGYWYCAPAPDLSIEYLGIPGYRYIQYRIANVGNVRFPSLATITIVWSSPTEFYHAPTIVWTEAELDVGETRTTSIEIGYIWCGRGKQQITLNASAIADWDVNTANNVKTVTIDNMCANCQQDSIEDGIDCGGWCPNRCVGCSEVPVSRGDAEDAGYFDLYSAVVRNTALQALQEYANCLRCPVCRRSLIVTDRGADFSSITADDLQRSTDYIMEAVAWYVDRHTYYMFDDDCDICDDDGVISAEDMIQRSGSRTGYNKAWGWVSCPNDYCGDCEDHAVLREALMRSLNISYHCAFCADHYNGYWGEGHTFNLVRYKNKWRIMDYGPLGTYFNNRWEAENPHNVWNDHVGEYWCPDWISDPECWFCCNTDPYRYTLNYGSDSYGNDNPCPPGGGRNTYYEFWAP